MAVTTSDRIDPVEPIDLFEEPDIQDIRPRVPHPSAIDPSKVRFSYDAPSDTLLLHLLGRDRPTVAVYLAEYAYVLVDPHTNEIAGFQIDDFLARAAREQPRFLAALEVAELRGITLEEVRAIRHEILGYRGRLAAWMRRIGRRLHGGPRTQRRQEAMDVFLNDPHYAPFGTAAMGAD